MISNDKLNKAVVEYLGFDSSSFPDNNVSLVSSKYGIEYLDEVVKVIEELGRIQPDWEKGDLNEVAKYSVDELLLKYPFLNDKSNEALIWAFTYWWK